MKAIFAYTYNIESIDVKNNDTTSLVGNWIECLFKGCKELKELDLSIFDISNISIYESLFVGCEELEIIYMLDT